MSQKKSNRRKPTRREMLVGCAAGWATVTIVPRHVLGGPGFTPPSEIRKTAAIGVGSQGIGKVNRNSTFAVCDVSRQRLAAAQEKAAPGCMSYTDFRHILDRRDIDEVFISTPPHWHAVMTIMAAQAGKSVWCEKPLARTIGEGRAVVEAIRRHGCSFGYGAYSTGTPADLLAKAYRSRLLGWPLTVYQSEPWCPFKVQGWTGPQHWRVEAVPEWLDWDLYCGPSPLRPYTTARFGGGHRGWWDYDGGGVSDMGGHIFNSIVGAIDKGHTSPVEIEADAPPADEQVVGIWYTGRLRYADGTTLVLDSGLRPNATPASQRGVYIEGPAGVLYLERGGPRTDPPWLLDALQSVQLPGPIPSTQSIQDPVQRVIHAHRTISVVHLFNIAVRMGRPIRFDPDREEIVGDDQANALINQPMRAPWRV
jgi:myo-inositol 2-dehydrogenase/D-chiro-inositol 1-dehydrogenase